MKNGMRRLAAFLMALCLIAGLNAAGVTAKAAAFTEQSARTPAQAGRAETARRVVGAVGLPPFTGRSLSDDDEAKTNETYEEALQVLTGLGIVGDHTTVDSHSGKDLTLGEAVAKTVRMMLGNDPADKLVDPIQFAEQRGLIPKGQDPNQKISGTEMAVILLRAIGYGVYEQNNGNNWDINKVAASLYSGVFGDSADSSAASREEAALLVWNNLIDSPSYDVTLSYYNGYSAVSSKINDDTQELLEFKAQMIDAFMNLDYYNFYASSFDSSTSDSAGKDNGANADSDSDGGDMDAADGETILTEVENEDGSKTTVVTIRYPNGLSLITATTKYEDGSTHVTLAQEQTVTTVQTNEDGSVITTTATITNEKETLTDKDGHITITITEIVSSKTIKESESGTVTTNTDSEKTITLYDNGDYETSTSSFTTVKEKMKENGVTKRKTTEIETNGGEYVFWNKRLEGTGEGTYQTQKRVTEEGNIVNVTEETKVSINIENGEIKRAYETVTTNSDENGKKLSEDEQFVDVKQYENGCICTIVKDADGNILSLEITVSQEEYEAALAEGRPIQASADCDFDEAEGVPIRVILPAGASGGQGSGDAASVPEIEITYRDSESAVGTVNAEGSFVPAAGADGPDQAACPHTNAEITYVWSADHKACTATLTCNDCGFTDSADAARVDVDTEKPTCKKEGRKTYTASFAVDWAEPRKEIVILALADHTWSEGVETVQATCGQPGRITYTCLVCGTAQVIATPPTGEHSWDEGKETTPPCVRPGVITYTCTVCQATKTSPIPATGEHVWDEGTTITAPTCVQTGLTIYTCKACGEHKPETVPATGVHAWDEGTATIPPTCIEPGEITYTCSVCGTVKRESVPATGNHTWNEATVITPPTCLTDGLMTYTCSVCFTKKTTPIPAAGAHDWDEGEVTTPPTCEEPGVMTYTCSICHATKTSPIPAVGAHDWDEGEVTTPPSCEEPGVMTYTCSICHATKTSSIPAIGEHDWDNGKVTSRPTCVDLGEMTFTCNRCGATFSYWLMPTGEHAWDDGEVTTQPTCGHPGVITYTCIICDATYEDEIASTENHDWDQGQETTPPNCITPGVMTYTCSVCGATIEGEIAPNGQHTRPDDDPVIDESTIQPATCVSGLKYDMILRCAVCSEIMERTPVEEDQYDMDSHTGPYETRYRNAGEIVEWWTVCLACSNTVSEGTEIASEFVIPGDWVAGQRDEIVTEGNP